jgi:hypothetical protein
MITVNMPKAKDIAHVKRRAARSAEFEPYDAIIAKQIPGADHAAAEAARQAIREKYAAVQAEIEDATDAAALVAIVRAFEQKPGEGG